MNINFFNIEDLKFIQLILGILCFLCSMLLLMGRKALESLSNILDRPILSIDRLRTFLDVEISAEKLKEFLEKRISTDILKDRMSKTILVDKAVFKWIKIVGLIAFLTSCYLIFTYLSY